MLNNQQKCELNTDESVSFIKAEKVVHDYREVDDDGNSVVAGRALDGVSLEIERGQFVAILGHNGSGKSTFARHLNALLKPETGTLWVNGMDTANDNNTWNIRQSAGLVFQNPDNQIIGTVVEEDVGFGPENLGVPTEDIWKRVEDSLHAVNMSSYRKKSPMKLSGGQKQRVAIAGVLAMKPDCIVMDEPTAMLDPVGRREVLDTVKRLNREENVTIVLITHYMEEVTDVDKIYVMDNGKVVLSGTPREVFSQVEVMKTYRLDVPQATEIAYRLRKDGYMVREDVLDMKELAEEIGKIRKEKECH